MINGLAIKEDDYEGVRLKPEAQERMMFYVESYFNEHKRYDINVIAQEMGVHYNTAKGYVKKHCEQVRQGLLEKEDDIALIQRRLYDVLCEVRNNPSKYGFTDKDEKERVRFEMELVDRILMYKKLDNPIESLEDVKAAALVVNSMGTRIADYLNERLNRKPIEQDAEPTN